MTLSRDDGAQSNIDFLFGLAVFLMAFLYVFTFIPGLFVPYQASAVDLSSVVYKTGAVLVEDPGWYIYTMDGKQMGNPAWETQDMTRLARIGLAIDRSQPNVLSLSKIQALSNLSSRSVVHELGDRPSYAVIRDKIGLAGTLTYSYSLGLVMNNTLAGRYDTLLNITTYPKGESVEYMERNVLIDEGRQLFVDGQGISDVSSVLQVSLTDMQVDDFENVTFRVFNVSGPGTIDRVMWKSVPTDLPVPLVYKSQYLVRKNGTDVQSLPVSFGPNDKMEIIVYNTEIRHLDMNYIWVVSTGNVFPNGQINYYNDPDFRLRSVCYPGVFKVEVWADAFV
jgi:hypothetical protein